MSGYQIRLGTLFNNATGRSFVTVVDHAVTLGPMQGNIDARKTLATAIGLPVIVESVLYGSRVTVQKYPEMLAFGPYTSADIVKTEYSDDPATMDGIMNGCPVPLLVHGGLKTNDPDALWQGSRDAVTAGAIGIIYGRNVWQSDDPIVVSRMLRDFSHGPSA